MKDSHFTPKKIVSELDRFIVGQADAKRAVSIALRNRWRRRNVAAELRDEIVPKNIIMIGPTGVGKTEIARRLAKLAEAPFIKVEASKFTEVGYVGKDVESMIRELTEIAVKMVRVEEEKRVSAKARELAEERLLDLLLPGSNAEVKEAPAVEKAEGDGLPNLDALDLSDQKREATRERLRKLYREGKLEGRFVEIEPQQRQHMPSVEVVAAASLEEMSSNIRDIFSSFIQPGKKRRKMPVKEAIEYLEAEEVARLLDMDEIITQAIERVEQNGIVFLDEIDKIAAPRGGDRSHGPDVSREGVQRDILPIIEGSTVNTKHGLVRTDHILFIAAGAFHISKPSDLIPELQGRFPIRVELTSLNKEDFYRILTEPDNCLIKQYKAMLDTEGVTLEFLEDGIKEICEVAAEVNEQLEDIGARRLHTVLEKLIEDVSFSAPEMHGERIDIDCDYVKAHLSEIVKNRDLRRYIL